MSVILNEAAITALFETPGGPVARFVEHTAEVVVSEVQRDVQNYFRGAPTGVEKDVQLSMQGSTAIVGFKDDPEGHHTRAESKSRRLVRLEWAQEWLQKAVE
jgi:hypothetical protein